MKLRTILTDNKELLYEVTEKSAVEKIKKDCAPYFDINRHFPLYRGMKVKVNDIKKVKAYMDDRKPKDTPMTVHNMLNEMFIKYFGWPVRNGVMCSGRHSATSYYGEVYLFFPIGKFEFAWSPTISDLFSKITPGDKDFVTEENILLRGGIVPCLIRWLTLSNYDVKSIVQELRESLKHWPGWYMEVTAQQIYKDEIQKFLTTGSPKEKVRKAIPLLLNPTFSKIISDYKSTDLITAIKSGNEISFKCQEYYLVEEFLWDRITQ